VVTEEMVEDQCHEIAIIAINQDILLENALNQRKKDNLIIEEEETEEVATIEIVAVVEIDKEEMTEEMIEEMTEEVVEIDLEEMIEVEAEVEVETDLIVIDLDLQAAIIVKRMDILLKIVLNHLKKEDPPVK